MKSKYKCLVVDDEPLAIDIIRDYIGRVPQLELTGTCENAMEAFEMLSKNEIDLLLLDIEMPELNGLEFIKSLVSPPPVILTTAYREYALASYEADVIDYLLKPISFQRFFKSITKFLKSAQKVSDLVQPPDRLDGDGSIYIYADKKNVKVYFKDILYIESIKDYVRVHTTGRNLISKDTITSYEHRLPHQFLRIHRSYIVNTNVITAFTHHDVEIGSKEIPIGGSYKNKVLECLKGKV